jgi:putative methyltransferase (TIGR04325 family)
VRNLRKLLTPPIFSIVSDKCSRGFRKRHSGYESKQLVDLIITKNKNFRNNINTSLDLNALRIISAISLLGIQKQLNVLDFGGGGGHHHATAQAVFPEKNFRWTVIETGALVKAAADRLEITNLYFSENFTEQAALGDTIDLIHSNSAIQYTDNPVNTIKLLKGLDYKYMFITKVPLAIDSESFEYVQESRMSSNGPGAMPGGLRDSIVEYPAKIIKYSEFKKILSHGCEILYELNEGPWDSIRFGRTVGTFTFALRKL